MKKTLLIKIASILPAIFMILPFYSCEKDNGTGNDKEDNTVSENPIKNIKADYSMNFSEDVLKFYDIEGTYGINGKTEKTESVTKTSWSTSCTYTEKDLPESVFCKAVMTPKADRPSIDPEAIYTVTKDKSCSVSAIYKDGKNSVLNIYENSSSNPVKGKKFEEYLNKGQQVVCDYSYSIQY